MVEADAAMPLYLKHSQAYLQLKISKVDFFFLSASRMLFV